MPAQTGYYDTLKSVAGKVFSYLASITLTGVDGKTLTVNNNATIDQSVAIASSPVFAGGTIADVGIVKNAVNLFVGTIADWVNQNIDTFDDTGASLNLVDGTLYHYCYLAVAKAPTTIGKKYRFTCAIANLIGSWYLSSYNDAQTIGTMNSASPSFDFVATTTGGLRISSTTGVSAGDFSNFTLKEIGLSVAANNAGAAAAGVAISELYRTNADPAVVCIRTI